MSAATCRGCGKPLRAGIRVCTNCGLPLDATPPPTQPVAGPTDPVVRVPTTPPGSTAQPAGKVITLKTAHVAILAVVVAVILVGAVAAGGMTKPERRVAGELVGQLPFGPDGGSQTFDDGAGVVNVPKGALDAPATIEVRRRAVREQVTAASPTGQQLSFPPGALVAYTFGPITLTFDRPITITFQRPVAGEGALIFVTTTDGEIRFYTGNTTESAITIRLNALDLSSPGAIDT